MVAQPTHDAPTRSILLRVTATQTTPKPAKLSRDLCYIGAAGPGRHAYLASDGHGTYLCVRGANGVYVCDQECRGYQYHGHCWHQAHAADLDRAEDLIAASIPAPVESAVDHTLLATITDDDPPHCARKNLDGQCRRTPDPLYGQGVFCIGHASEAYQIGLLNWADVERPARTVAVAS